MSNNNGIVFDALEDDDYPVGIMSHICSVVDTRVVVDSSHHIRKNFFYGFGTHDGESIPTHPKLLGNNDKGHLSGQWTHSPCAHAGGDSIPAVKCLDDGIPRIRTTTPAD